MSRSHDRTPAAPNAVKRSIVRQVVRRSSLVGVLMLLVLMVWSAGHLALSDVSPLEMLGLTLPFVIAGAVFIFVVRHVLKTEIQRVQDELNQRMAKRIETHDTGPLPSLGVEEFDPFIDDFNALIERAQQRIQMLSAIETATRIKAAEVDRDKLTGLRNRGYLDKHLADDVSRARALGDELSVIMCDVDHFKHYNDTNGHQMGDKVLQAVGQLLTSNVRSNDTCIRYGGEEFLIVMPRTSLERAMRSAERIREAIACYPIPGMELQPGGKLTLSLGVAVFPLHANTSETLVKRADEALYAAKQGGRNRVVSSDQVKGQVIQRHDTETL